MEGQDVDVSVVYDIKLQSKSYPSKAFIDISSNSCIVFLCCVLVDKQSPFWMARGAVKWVSYGV